MNSILSALSLLCIGILDATLAVSFDYLESSVSQWATIFFVTQSVCCVFVILYWMSKSLLDYHLFYQNSSLDINSASISEYFWYPFLSLKNNDAYSWLFIIINGVSNALTIAFFIIALAYIDSANFIVIQVSIISFVGIIIQNVSIHFKMSLINIGSFVLYIIGLICVCQSNFTLFDGFNDNQTSNASVIGFLFAILSGLLYICSNLSYTYLQTQYNIDNLAIIIISNLISAILSILFFIAIICLVATTESQYILWFQNDNGDITIKEIVLFITGLVLFLRMLIMYLNDQYNVDTIDLNIENYTQNNRNNALRWILSFIKNSDIIMVYLLQLWILNEANNWLDYLGALMIIAARAILLFEQDFNNTNLFEDTRAQTTRYQTRSRVYSEHEGYIYDECNNCFNTNDENFFDDQNDGYKALDIADQSEYQIISEVNDVDQDFDIL